MPIKQPSPNQETPPASTPTAGAKRRRKNEGGNEEGPQGPSEPRRLRRSHEACARCRGKKIKASPDCWHLPSVSPGGSPAAYRADTLFSLQCDSKHPRCTACATAGVECNQEDRHRQTLTPRGYTERIELQLAQCEALLKRHLPGFSLDSLEDYLARDGIDIGGAVAPTFQMSSSPLRNSFRSEQPVPPGGPPKGYPLYPPPPPGMLPPPPGYPPHMMPYPPPGPYHPSQMPPMPGPYNPHIHPAFQQHPQYVPAEIVEQGRAVATDIKGQDPKSNDMSSTQSLAKSFGVSAAIVSDLKLGPTHIDREDLAVGSNGLSSGRDRSIAESSAPRDTANWRTVSVRRNSNAALNSPRLPMMPRSSSPSSVDVWLPKDRGRVQQVVDIYFTRLNVHRPVFFRKVFEKALDDLYLERTVIHDPGFICSLYLVLALGTLSEISNRSAKLDVDSDDPMVSGATRPKSFTPDWPEHDEFFERALSVKPDLRVTISSLQALILLHWYLYTERQGRTLWRLVGSLVRLAIELGLHHDPTTQLNPANQMNPNSQQCIFSEEESQLRIRLWGIVLVHDRGTSLLLGRPLAIAPSDANTPRPSRMSSAARLTGLGEDFSEHFDLSHPVAEIQADIINSLYSPSRQSGDTIMRNATRIIKSMVEFRRGLPDKYKYYFSGTEEWPMERKSKLVQEITEDEGLTLLKVGISRILLLRALFSLKELTYAQRRKALVDAIITSHNTIIVHSQLIRYPDIAFFTSPIPLHIAAMVILYGHMSKCDKLPRHTALEDVWLALDMLPRFRWRWERKDVNGGHPLIAKLAERVLEANLHQVGPATHPVLLSEADWDEDTVLKSPNLTKSQQNTPTLSTPPYGPGPQNGPPYSPQQRQMNGGAMNGTTPPGKNAPMPDCGHMFYPFYPEAGQSEVNGVEGHNHQDYSQLLAVAAVPPSQDSYMSEERDGAVQNEQGMWIQSMPPVGCNR
ncbi:fungal-specific transcription factor domain-containing protein [Armillaria novae-zelandiae]|uniref:Fungal-specific transcription factor domain-containing protein n=1 Tax=Armillaria novae-zelandiae TaxID=153914 RepID=A0AA39U8N7_9AGAR|nr:fungal-specific transcription factor domain-containing protein [Armillaria novae-zelandiae]